jgi:succinate-semialdehyde dehydrogenase/glutarate-semialdehyde dehydrogenase
MPRNYPFNQVLRSSIPNIMAGNVVLMKHASNVPQIAEKIEQLFDQAGFPKGVYTNLFLPHDFTEKIIAHPLVIGANVTGSDSVGRQLGALAGKYLKPSILELG